MSSTKKMAAAGDFPSPDPKKRPKQRFTYESEELVESDWMDETKGRAKNRPARKRNSGILRADSSAGQRRGSASSVDFRFDHLNPQVMECEVGSQSALCHVMNVSECSQAGRASPLPSVDRLSVSFVGERDVSSITSSAPNDNFDWPTSPHYAEGWSHLFCLQKRPVDLGDAIRSPTICQRQTYP